MCVRVSDEQTRVTIVAVLMQNQSPALVTRPSKPKRIQTWSDRVGPFRTESNRIELDRTGGNRITLDFPTSLGRPLLWLLPVSAVVPPVAVPVCGDGPCPGQEGTGRVPRPLPETAQRRVSRHGATPHLISACRNSH